MLFRCLRSDAYVTVVAVGLQVHMLAAKAVGAFSHFGKLSLASRVAAAAAAETASIAAAGSAEGSSTPTEGGSAAGEEPTTA